MNRRSFLKTSGAFGTAIWSGLPMTATAQARPSRNPSSAPRRRSWHEACAGFDEESRRIYERHFAQTRDTVRALKNKYEDQIVVGRIGIWDLVQKLAYCVDATDRKLYCANQLIHVQQIVETMERDGITDSDMYLAALTHDLGKVLLLAGEAQENVMCANRPIGEFEPRVGLDRVVLQWNHDEFIYSRLKDLVPDHVAWLLRYHSILVKDAEPYFDERDRRYAEKYLKPFRSYDLGTKTPCHLPPMNILDKYRDLLERTFPKPLLV